MTADILATVAWQCGDKDCTASGGWHKGNYWSNGKKWTYDAFGDGDHEEIDENEIPSSEEEVNSLIDYARWVLANGDDPLDNYIVKRSRTIKEVWFFRFSRSILGSVMCQAKHGKRLYLPREVPKHVAQYLNLVPLNGRPEIPTGKMQDFKSWQEFVDAVPGVKQSVWFRADIEHNQPRSSAAYARELRAAARKHLEKSGAVQNVPPKN